MKTKEELLAEKAKLIKMNAIGEMLVGDLFKDTLAKVQIDRELARVEEELKKFQ